jgi:hypothetical protein
MDECVSSPGPAEKHENGVILFLLTAYFPLLEPSRPGCEKGTVRT